jgi:molybdate transport system substrate-binding protein
MRRASFLITAVIAAAAAATLPERARAQGKPVVTVFAAASLREAFEAAAPAFTNASGFPVRYDFGGSDTLATQILQGAPVDVFASANAAQMQRVAAAVHAPKTFAHNHVVVIAPAGDSAVATIADLGKAGVKVVLAAPSVPVGAYARTTFQTLAHDPAYGAGFAGRVAANVVSEETDVKAVVTKVALGEADAGVVYATDVTPSVAAKLRELRFAPGTAPEAAYPIAVVSAAPNPAGAQAFVDFITSPAGMVFMKARGFEE